MGIVVLIFLYFLLAVSIFAFVHHFCAVTDSKRKVIIYLVFVTLCGLIVETVIKQGVVILFIAYFFIAYFLSLVVFKVSRLHSIAISSIYSLVRISVITLWAFVFNIEL